MILLVSCSLNPESRSRILANAARNRFLEQDEPVEFVDLREMPLPFCDGGSAYEDPNARRLSELGGAADAIVIAAPIYNFSIAATAKNLVVGYSFPSELCSDRGRAINSNDPDWPETLQGKAKQFYERYLTYGKPQGFKLKAMVINFPGGMPGDIGFYLNWQPPAR